MRIPGLTKGKDCEELKPPFWETQFSWRSRTKEKVYGNSVVVAKKKRKGAKEKIGGAGQLFGWGGSLPRKSKSGEGPLPPRTLIALLCRRRREKLD